MEVLVASQVANEEKVRQAIALGVSDYLLKPLQYDWVIQRLKRAADRIYDRRRTAGKYADSSRTRVLVADADPNYCAFAESTLSADFTIEASRTMAETLVKTLRFRPDVLLFCPEMPGLNARFLLERLGSLPGNDPPQVYELKTGGGEPSAEGVSGVIARTFVPETLRSQLISLLRGGEAPDHGVLGWASSLKSEMRTALFQALGMLTGVEPEPVANPPAQGSGGAYGWIAIDADDGDFTMRLDLESGRDLPLGLMAAMLGEAPAADDGSEPPLDAIQEILNVVAGRLKNSCLERKIDVSIGLPTTGFQPPPEREAQFEHGEWFRWNGGSPFRVRFDASPSKGKGRIA
jgi:CheY-like chemotaxis protein